MRNTAITCHLCWLRTRPTLPVLAVGDNGSRSRTPPCAGANSSSVDMPQWRAARIGVAMQPQSSVPARVISINSGSSSQAKSKLANPLCPLLRASKVLASKVLASNNKGGRKRIEGSAACANPWPRSSCQRRR